MKPANSRLPASSGDRDCMMMTTDTANETGSVPARRKSDTDRRCLVTRAVKPKLSLIRFVVDPDGMVTPDLEGRLPGRGMWVSARRQALQQAVDKKMFGRAARRTVTVPDGLVDRIEVMLSRRCVELLALARRAGLAVGGFEKVRARLRAGNGGLLLAASDGAEDGRGKLAALAPELPIVDSLDAAQIGAAFGRDHVVHAVLSRGALTKRLHIEMVRLAGVRGTLETGPVGRTGRKPGTAGRRQTTQH